MSQDVWTEAEPRLRVAADVADVPSGKTVDTIRIPGGTFHARFSKAARISALQTIAAAIGRPRATRNRSIRRRVTSDFGTSCANAQKRMNEFGEEERLGSEGGFSCQAH
jgi:hypothetical protein